MPERESAGRVLNLVIKFVLGGLLNMDHGSWTADHGEWRADLGRVEKERNTEIEWLGSRIQISGGDDASFKRRWRCR